MLVIRMVSNEWKMYLLHQPNAKSLTVTQITNIVQVWPHSTTLILPLELLTNRVGAYLLTHTVCLCGTRNSVHSHIFTENASFHTSLIPRLPVESGYETGSPPGPILYTQHC